MRSSKKTGISALVALVLGIAMLAGCTPASNNLDCTPAALESAKTELQTAQTAANKDGVKGTGSPDEADAQAAVSIAQDKVDQLTKCEANPTGTPTPSANPTDTTCQAKFTQVPLSHEGNQVDDQNRAKYEAAVKNVTNLSDAQREFFNAEAGTSAQKLAIWSHAFGLHADPNDWTTLLTDDKTCLNEAGKELWYSTKGAVSAKGVTFEEAQAPENGWNSGVHGGIYGTSADQGVRGDRTAIKITLADGTVVYILIRCGNPVYPGKPSLPDVPTDNPPTPEGKNINDAPQRQGNLPTQQMPNVLPAAPEYAQPAEPASPPSVYVPPTAPEPAPPAQEPSQPTPVPTKDPAPAPAPRPSAPTPENPETGYDPSAP